MDYTYMYQVCQGNWVSSYLRPGVKDSSLRSEFNLVQPNIHYVSMAL